MYDVKKYGQDEDEGIQQEFLPAGLNSSLSSLATFYFPKERETSDKDLELARIEADTYTELARIEARKVTDLADTLADMERDRQYAMVRREWIKQDALETRALISETSKLASQRLAMEQERGNSPAKVSVKSQLGGIFGKKCKITIESEPGPSNVTVRRGWLT